MPEVNIPALTYFAASIFWRGSIHPWKSDGTRPVPLGPYEEPLRQYLLGEADFPEEMTLSVVVRMPSEISHFTYEPLGEWRGLLFGRKVPHAWTCLWDFRRSRDSRANAYVVLRAWRWKPTRIHRRAGETYIRGRQKDA